MSNLSIIAIIIVLLLSTICIGYVSAESNEEETVNTVFQSAISHRSQGEYDKAVEIIKIIILNNPGNDRVLKRAYKELVFTYLSMGDTKLMDMSAREALMRWPDITCDSLYIPPNVGEIFNELRTKLFGTLLVTTDPDSCHVKLDGKYIGESPLDIEYIKSGEHELRLLKEEYHEFSRVILIEPGMKTNADYSMEKIIADSRSGFGIGAGIIIPYSEADKYSKGGFAIQGFGSVGLPFVPFAIIRASTQGLFFRKKEIGGLLVEDAARKDAWNTIIKLGLGIELFKKSNFLETFVGAGTSIHYVWNNLKFESESGEKVDSWTQTSGFFRSWSRNFLGLNLNSGIRMYFAKSVAFDLCIQYDWIPNVIQVSENLETILMDLESFSIMANIYFGRTHGRN